MLSKKEKIRLFLGFLILSGIFMFIFISSYVEKNKSNVSLLNIDRSYEKSLPSNFNKELFNVETLNASKFLVSEDENVIGFSMNCSAVDSFSSIKNKLENNGWKSVESGNNTSGSFWKQYGEITWTFLNCTEVGGETSVVLTCN